MSLHIFKGDEGPKVRVKNESEAIHSYTHCICITDDMSDTIIQNANKHARDNAQWRDLDKQEVYIFRICLLFLAFLKEITRAFDFVILGVTAHWLDEFSKPLCP